MCKWYSSLYSVQAFEQCSMLVFILFPPIQCIELLEMNFQRLITALEKPSLPKDGCSYLGMCPQQHPIITRQTPLQASVTLPGVCEVCELVIAEVFKLIDANSSVTAITAALDEVCQTAHTDTFMWPLPWLYSIVDIYLRFCLVDQPVPWIPPFNTSTVFSSG